MIQNYFDNVKRILGSKNYKCPRTERVGQGRLLNFIIARPQKNRAKPRVRRLIQYGGDSGI